MFTNSGVQLVGSEAARLSFNPQGTVSAATLWDSDPAESNLGSLMLVAGNGTTIDLIANKSIRSGKIAAYLEMRDNILVQAQNQLDAWQPRWRRRCPIEPSRVRALPQTSSMSIPQAC